MIGLNAAINRLSFAEARSVGAEALVSIARHRTEVEQATANKTATESQKTSEFLERAREHHRIDKTA